VEALWTMVGLRAVIGYVNLEEDWEPILGVGDDG
jgi:hypothetical protein